MLLCRSCAGSSRARCSLPAAQVLITSSVKLPNMQDFSSPCSRGAGGATPAAAVPGVNLGTYFRRALIPPRASSDGEVPQTSPVRYKILINLQKFPICK